MEEQILLYLTLGLLLFTCLLVLIVGLQVLQFVNLVTRKEATQTQSEHSKESLWIRIYKRYIAGDLVPVGLEEKRMLDHSYDGIQELDNSMPPWLKYLFYGTIAFAFIYLVNFFVLDLVKTSEQEYLAEMESAAIDLEQHKKLASAGIDESNVKLVTDAAALENAKVIFDQYCKACHGGEGEGGVGPNLTDEYWIHGGTINDVFKTVKYGVPDKGMIAWQQKLKPEELQILSSFVLSLQGTNPPNAKEPQGDKVSNSASNSKSEVSMKQVSK